MIIPRFFDDIPVGEQRTSFGRTITESDIITHAGQTGDFYPHHMDAEWCKTQPFGQRIAHGTLIFSVAVGMTAGAINPHAMSYGYDRLRFVKPVFIGDTLTVTATISEKRPHAKRTDVGVLVEQLSVRNQHADVVLACEHLYLVTKQS
jgi:acyl dehydratase